MSGYSVGAGDPNSGPHITNRALHFLELQIEASGKPPCESELTYVVPWTEVLPRSEVPGLPGFTAPGPLPSPLDA